MAVDPKILAQMKRTRPPEDDGVPTEEYLDGMTPLTGAPPVEQRSGLPTLVGTPKQVKWALTIREDTLKLAWPTETEAKLKSIVDSTWWIANKTIVNSMKFKEPSPQQLAGAASPTTGRPPQPGSSPAPAASTSPHQRRLNDAILWAESVSRHPTLAQAAILSCLRFAYPKGAMRDQITAKAREILSQANMEVNRDTSAIQLMLSKE
jgi:hypothetical protein